MENWKIRSFYQNLMLAMESDSEKLWKVNCNRKKSELHVGITCYEL